MVPGREALNFLRPDEGTCGVLSIRGEPRVELVRQKLSVLLSAAVKNDWSLTGAQRRG